MKTPRTAIARPEPSFSRPPAPRTTALSRIAPLLLLPFLASCGPYTTSKTTAVASEGVALSQGAIAVVGSQAISPDTLLGAWIQRNQGTVAPADKAAVLDDLIRRELLHAEARRTAFDERPDILAAWRDFVINRFAEERERTGGALPPPTEAEIEDHYERHLSHYSSPERIRAALILIRQSPLADEERKEALVARLAALRDQAVQQADSAPDFGELARAHSEHRATRHLGGDVGWMTHDTAAGAWPDEVVTALFALRRQGEISPAIRTSEGLFLLKLIARQPSEPLPLADVRERISQQLSRTRALEAEAAFYEGLKRAHPVRIDTNLLAELCQAPPRVAIRPPHLPLR
ncbi:MAG: peptidyl-prolyl cis-trans isomerase [Verrucomicrobiae bacterium]|nr:peptidyl-prolyl cis-trans isomerase [Verrucomicrobiae bacterium]